jgi:hypothetical protein
MESGVYSTAGLYLRQELCAPDRLIAVSSSHSAAKISRPPALGKQVSPHATVSSSSRRTRRPPCPAPDLPRLLRSAIAFAHSQLRRFFWRSSRTGVLPDGYDASSIAAQAFLQFFLHSKEPHSRNSSAMSWMLENLQKRLRRRWQVVEKACLVKKV